MELKINLNSVNQFVKGSVIYTEGDPLFSVALILKGRVLIENNGAKYILNTGNFIAVNDLYTGRYQSTYSAYDDMILYAFSAYKKQDLESILSSNKEYEGFMISSFNKTIYELNKIYDGLFNHGTKLYQFLTDSYIEYLNFSKRLGLKLKNSDRIGSLSVVTNSLEAEKDRINYYIECRNMPVDVIKAFYSYGNSIALYQIENQIEIINKQLEALKELSEDIAWYMSCLFDNSDSCLFNLTTDLILSAGCSDDSYKELTEFIDRIIEQINLVDNFYNDMVGRKLSVNRTKMEEIYFQILSNNKKGTKNDENSLACANEDAEKVLKELENSLAKLLDYAEVDSKKMKEMLNEIQEYCDIKDKFEVNESSRHLRRKITDNFYDLYTRVFIKAYHSKEEAPKIVDLFLNYGYADERLLTREQLISLYFLKDDELKTPCKVYTIKEWLTMIYEGKKEPSKNEFDLDYQEMVTSLKKQAKIKESEVKEWLADPTRKLDYEIQNMFRYNNKVANGQISTFIPILHKEIFSNNINKLFITSKIINEAFNDLLKIDYSVFDREALYVNKEKNIVKEYIVKRVYPDVILMPTCGSNGVMWQEITGKKRDTAGRFLLPIFTEISLSAILIKLFGRFRWELCRSIQGISWNDIKYKSLTSEYVDYLQFYRKNRELSEEWKERLKLQIQKGRNNSREIFVIDYENWIKSESMVAIKLNKTVREIMATYCPFSIEIREKLKLSPIFDEAMARYNREKAKKIREIESRYRALAKESIELTQELVDTLSYYKDL